MKKILARIASTAAALSIAATGLAATAPTASASAVSGTPILLVHGMPGPLGLTPTNPSVDCSDSTMTTWKEGLRARGFRNVLTVGFLKGDVNCDLNVPGRSNNTLQSSIKEFGKELTALIDQRFSNRGINVAIAAYDMGGLVVRSGLDGVEHHRRGYPRDILVSDVVTAATPHGGTATPMVMPLIKVLKEQLPGSTFLTDLNSRNNPQASAAGTDWTLMGSAFDLSLPIFSAHHMERGGNDRPEVEKLAFLGFNSSLISLGGQLDAMADSLKTSR